MAAAALLAAAMAPAPAEAQFFRRFRSFFRPVTNFFNNMFTFSSDGGTSRPQATGRDELFPRDCGRDPRKNTGKLCFPDGLLCQQSKSTLNLL